MDYYIVYYKIENVYYYYDGKEFNSTKELYKLKLVQYEIHQSYDKTNDGLFSYHNNMKIWTEEIYESTEFYYLGKYNDITASLHFFMKYNSKKNIHDFDRITFDESSWIEGCYNGGIQSCIPGDTQKTYSYDGRRFYQSLLSNDEFKISSKVGQEFTITKIPDIKNLKHGYYRVNITSNNPKSKMIFAFNAKNNVYYYYDILFALSHIELNFIIRLIIDDKPNCYLYENINIIKSNTVFQKWSNKINKLKELYSSNLLLKNLGSKLWGKLSQFNEFIVTGDELEKNLEKYNDCNIIRTKKFNEYGTKEYREIHYLQHANQPYKFSIRIKASLTSYGRYYIGNVASTNIDNLIRIHTDSMSFIRPFKIDKKMFKREEKTSNLIRFYSCNHYTSVCYNCFQEFESSLFINHRCW